MKDVEEILSRVRDGKTTADDARKLEAYFMNDSMVNGARNKLAYQDHIKKHGNAGVHANLDLNSFKVVNDLYGHSVGDDVIKGAGRVIADTGKKYGARVFRTGGDEFCLWFLHPNHAESFVNELKTNLEKLHHNLPEYNISASIGLGHSAQRAEQALMQAKDKNRTVTPNGTYIRHVDPGKEQTLAVSLLHYPVPDGWKDAETSIREHKAVV